MVQQPLIKPQIIRDIDPNVLQRQASDPTQSVWVGASAGSGKTKVLTDRILRLLLPSKNGLPGADPHKILALTFTKAAASEMALRISKNLSDWAVIPLEGDRGLIARLKNLLGQDPSKEQIDQARELFARVVDVPSGLKIMTIHSFCQSILGRFPLEADLPPSFKALEESEAKKLLKQAIEHSMRKAEQEKGSPLASALHHLLQFQNEQQIVALLQNITSEQRQLDKILLDNFDIDGLYTNLCQHFGVESGKTKYQIIDEFFDRFNKDDFWQISKTLQSSSKKKDQTFGLNLQLWLEKYDPNNDKKWEEFQSLFLTQKNVIRAKLATKEIHDQHPEIAEKLEQYAQQVLNLTERINALQIIEQTRDIFTLGKEIIYQYQLLKKETASLDFDDLILFSLKLLKGETATLDGLDTAPWIRFKLDQGIDHILVDESQDTNPEQWEIIKYLCDDFYDGSLENEKTRTVFVVGDEKQSIFSFQRASPEKFSHMREWFDQKINQNAQNLQKIKFNISFRSVPAILELVDQVFANDLTSQGLGDEILNHQSFRRSQLGLVELWPLFENPEKENTDPWALPTQIQDSTSSASMMANHIGDTIQDWLQSKTILESYDRPIKPGDIMILVRSRTAFIDQLVRALKTRDIPVSGVDRMILSDQLVVQDLCALASFALLPDDDLTLATILKSPFIGLNEEQLFDIAYRRQSSLWNSLKNKPEFENLTKWLQKLIQQAGKATPYEFFSQILNSPCPANRYSGLQAIKSRLGEESMDPLNEFINKSLEYETEQNPTLQNFVQAQLYDDTQIKRELEEDNNAVRIMTVHGAKGLQAPIVILPDTTRTANSYRGDKILWPDKTSQKLPYFCPTSSNLPEECVQAKETLRELDTQEYRRLLYVALTRAESRLYIGGYKGTKPIIDDSWYNYVANGFHQLDNVKHIPFGEDQKILQYSNPATDKPDRAEDHKDNQITQYEAPEWLFRQIPEEPFPPRPLMPSRPSDDDSPALSPLKALNNDRFKRGNITHKLLQILPDLPMGKREQAARNYVSEPSHRLSKDVQNNIVCEVMAIVTHKDFAPLFGPGSIAEAPVTGFINNNQLVSGQIDRLLITDHEIMIIDYKSNRPPPYDEKDVPTIYINQMRTYATLMREIYPDREIKAALLWTDGCRLMPLHDL